MCCSLAEEYVCVCPRGVERGGVKRDMFSVEIICIMKFICEVYLFIKLLSV